MIAATSVGIVNGNMLLDLCCEEDCQAEVDFNVVMTDRSEFVEIQGTADSLLGLAQERIEKLFRI